MPKLRICFEIADLARDEDGNPAPCGLEVSFDAQTEREIAYAELAEVVNIDKLLKLACLDKIASPEDVAIISPAEYDEKYGGGK